MLQGFATGVGTLEYSRRYDALTYQAFGRTSLVVSGAGVGGYRIDSSSDAHREALTKALPSGINIVDTSANYADGGSECLIGEVLSDLVSRQEIRRNEIVVVSKGGYLQGENYRLSQELQREGRPFPKIVPYGEGLEHCIHPQFLCEQISKSLERLQLETIDCYLLHNPEYYLKWAQELDLPAAEAQEEYLRRIREAFLYMEEEVARGQIRYYGISSNTFVSSQEDYSFTSLTKVWEIAETIRPDHHFRVIEFPCNLFEAGAITRTNQPSGETLLEFAVKTGVAVLINRPLNAIQGNGLIRLAENVYKAQAAKEAAIFRKQVAAVDPEWNRTDSLAHLALRALRSTKGVTAVLVGMRQVSYVEDVLQELHRPCVVEDRKSSWEKVQEITAAR